ncbi:hypothetical protein HETIRDRAFT_411101 [Heterobasidion irregulare TC 32-1]|uniref:Uncharacterized protein n=1 Tax=Heterobasidion irregulare (strain TC 32-1) TaxID=747525 RepID=W4JW92_HETIT|nr:uncharacterized protein HETIRDRAFT_411101 [Heterobasidion irregulare TC 32-1]ETW77739.1 hypothetical protein HETIRDRAFT_411101 [Heterobasidion irregulare TC 32-1]
MWPVDFASAGREKALVCAAAWAWAWAWGFFEFLGRSLVVDAGRPWIHTVGEHDLCSGATRMQAVKPNIAISDVIDRRAGVWDQCAT